MIAKGTKVTFFRGEVMTGYIRSTQKIADYYAVDEDPDDPMGKHWLVAEKEFLTVGDDEVQQPIAETTETTAKPKTETKKRKRFKNNIVEVIS